jgi:hypothetical protein
MFWKAIWGEFERAAQLVGISYLPAWYESKTSASACTSG